MFKWEDVEQQAFDSIKHMVTTDTLLAYQYLNKQCDIHTNDTNHYMGALISQGGKFIESYSHKLTELQTRYTVTEKVIT